VVAVRYRPRPLAAVEHRHAAEKLQLIWHHLSISSVEDYIVPYGLFRRIMVAEIERC
jgi:hypothetical protein